VSDELVLVANGKKISGWTSISVTLRCEGFPNSFSIALTTPATGDLPPVAAGDRCQVYLGDDLVITGYVDRDSGGGDATSHALSLTGRGLCCDLVDCSAEWPKGLISGDALAIAQKLAQPYGISVALANGAAAGPQVVGWALNYGEAAAAIIQRVAQNAGLLAYEDPGGRLLLAAIGSKSAKGGVVYGQNVESWSNTNSIDQRYSDVVCSSFAVASFDDLQGNDFFHRETDPNVKRHRQLDIVLGDVASENAQDFTIRKAQWEIARRAGRSTTVTATVDSWRDADGALWMPNTLVPVDLPGRLPAKQLCISEVTFRRDGEGTHADLVMLPKAAFLLEPISLLPINTADLKTPATS
jgi:prophage tail gpP-like protein